jgi:hypothetical protein
VDERAEMDARDGHEPAAASVLDALRDDIEDRRPRDDEQR